MKKIQYISIFLLMMLFLTSCQQKKEEFEISPKISERYFTFEEVLDGSTDIVKAKCLDVVNYEDNLEYTFQLTERYVGEDIGEIFYLYVMDWMVDRTPTYEPEQEYFLMLWRTRDVYAEHDKYINYTHRLYLPCSSFDQANMYDEAITEHSNMESCATAEELEQYIVEYLANHPIEDRPLYVGVDYIDSSDMKTIVEQSEFVAVVQVKELHNFLYDAWDRDDWLCTVMNVLKGDLEVDEEIDIIFPKDAVRVGDIYIVTLASTDGSIYSFSAKNSIYPISELDQIQEYLNKD